MLGGCWAEMGRRWGKSGEKVGRRCGQGGMKWDEVDRR